MNDFVNAILPNHTVSLKETRQSDITTSWGVDWDEEMIARDLLQNFYDANRDCLDRIRTDIKGGTVTIYGPEETVLERLQLLGSEKGKDDIGKFGEGFKVAVVCLIRKHGIDPIVLSQQSALRIRLSESTVKDTSLKPLLYDYYTVTGDKIDGTTLILRNCSRKLQDALKCGLYHFFYKGNPLLGDVISEEEKVSAYESRESNGYVYYRGLRRATIVGIPIILCINKEYIALEKLTGQDRDRKMFGTEILEKSYTIFAKAYNKYNSSIPYYIVKSSKALWKNGHPLLRSITSDFNPWSRKQTEPLFGENYYATTYECDSKDRQSQIEALERDWETDGRIRLPAYFSTFGVISAGAYLNNIDKADREKQKRGPSEAERHSIQILIDAVKELLPKSHGLLTKPTNLYSIAETDILLGEYKRHRNYRSTEIFLSAQLFTGDFSQAFSVFLHEHGHIVGHDGSRAFTDILTEMLAAAILYRSMFSRVEKKWAAAVGTVWKERETEPGKNPHDMLDELSREELLKLLKAMPQGILSGLL